MRTKLIIAGREFNSRLFVGTGKFSSHDVMQKALEASGTDIVTVALRRVDFNNPADDILNYIDRNKYILLPNTAGAKDCDQAVRLARMARAAGCEAWVKLEVTPDPRYLLPDPVETLKAAEILVKEGFTVLPYINADPVVAKRLQEVGTATVMPLGAPIGTNKGLRTKEQIAIIIEQAIVPVVVDAATPFAFRSMNAVSERSKLLGEDWMRLMMSAGATFARVMLTMSALPSVAAPGSAAAARAKTSARTSEAGRAAAVRAAVLYAVMAIPCIGSHSYIRQ